MSAAKVPTQKQRRSATGDLDRFWAKVLIEDADADGCWLWQAAGSFFSSAAGRLVSPRRYAWRVQQNQQLNEDTILRARCKAKACVNPAHMDPVWKGTRTDTHCSRRHEMNEENGYWSRDGTWTCRVCKRDHHRVYRQDPAFRAQQAQYSRDFARRNPEAIEQKKARARRRYAEDPAYRARALENARRRRERLRAQAQGQR